MKMAELIRSIQSAETDDGGKKSKPKFYLSDTISRGGKKYLVSTLSVPSFLQDMGDGKFETGVFLLDDDGKIRKLSRNALLELAERLGWDGNHTDILIY